MAASTVADFFTRPTARSWLASGAARRQHRVVLDHERLMRLAIEEAELARGTTGDNPWVGCLIVDAQGEILGRGHTQGPGEDHAEIAALRQARARGLAVEGATMYSTLEPCSFHGRTPACSRVIVDNRLGHVVTGMRDPNPRVDGVGVRILNEAGIGVTEGVCEREVRRQLGGWVLAYHPHEPVRRARALAATYARDALVAHLCELYFCDEARIIALIDSAGD
jgi:diaminohydroxyphosphoribosylaminopyrimidine deaminase/5-amino-6-(5-phosphoribosylamino)uracil reductase